MAITYVDPFGFGTTTLEVDEKTGIRFDGMKAYFTTADLQSDCAVPVENIVSITRF